MIQSGNVFHPDILIAGSGITGVSLARELSRWDVSVTVIDRADDIAEGATKANSGIVHAGYDAVPGTLKAKFNVDILVSSAYTAFNLSKLIIIFIKLI